MGKKSVILFSTAAVAVAAIAAVGASRYAASNSLMSGAAIFAKGGGRSPGAFVD